VNGSAIDRRTFTVQSVLALLSGVTITISACGGSTTPTSPTPSPSPSPSPSPGGTADVTGTVSANHGHIATVTGAQITVDNAISLNIMGQATHNHVVALTAADLTAIGGRQQVVKTSTTDSGHNHTVTFN
jgi:hypothetical protein